MNGYQDGFKFFSNTAIQLKMIESCDQKWRTQFIIMNDIFIVARIILCFQDIDIMSKTDTVESKHVVLIGAMYIQTIHLNDYNIIELIGIQIKTVESLFPTVVN